MAIRPRCFFARDRRTYVVGTRGRPNKARSIGLEVLSLAVAALFAERLRALRIIGARWRSSSGFDFAAFGGQCGLGLGEFLLEPLVVPGELPHGHRRFAAYTGPCWLNRLVR